MPPGVCVKGGGGAYSGWAYRRMFTFGDGMCVHAAERRQRERKLAANLPQTVGRAGIQASCRSLGRGSSISRKTTASLCQRDTWNSEPTALTVIRAYFESHSYHLSATSWAQSASRPGGACTITGAG